MPQAIAYKCKTPGCEGWLKTTDVGDDTPRSVAVPLLLNPPVKLICATCKQEHEYSASDKRLVGQTP